MESVDLDLEGVGVVVSRVVLIVEGVGFFVEYVGLGVEGFPVV